MYWSSENPHIHLEKHVNLPGLIVWCGLSSRGFIGSFYFEGTVAGALYLDMLQTSILPAIWELYGDEAFTNNKMALHPTTIEMSGCTWMKLPGRWIGRVEFPPRSPDLTPLEFYLWGSLKDDVYRSKPATRDDLRESIAMSCAAVTLDTLQNVVHAAVQRVRQCLDADGGHFENLRWIQNSRTSLISILLLNKYSSYDYRVIFFMSKCAKNFWATVYLQSCFSTMNFTFSSGCQFIGSPWWCPLRRTTNVICVMK